MKTTIIIPDESGDTRLICQTQQELKEGMKKMQVASEGFRNVIIESTSGEQELIVPKYTDWNKITAKAANSTRVMLAEPIIAG